MLEHLVFEREWAPAGQGSTWLELMVMLHLRGHDVACFSKRPICTVLTVLDGMKACVQQYVRDAVHPEQRS
eukprot:15350783-Alexandrium_andersonii.AAC.1